MTNAKVEERDRRAAYTALTYDSCENVAEGTPLRTWLTVGGDFVPVHPARGRWSFRAENIVATAIANARAEGERRGRIEGLREGYERGRNGQHHTQLDARIAELEREGT